MALQTSKQLSIPNKEVVLESNGLIGRVWLNFLNLMTEMVKSLGIETISELNNNQVTAANVDSLIFSSDKVSQFIVDYLVQRITTGGGASTLFESGTIHCIYNPIAMTWSLYKVNITSMTSAGITFSINSSGQVQYTTTNITGTASISRIAYRARTLAAKSSTYSKVGL